MGKMWRNWKRMAVALMVSVLAVSSAVVFKAAASEEMKKYVHFIDLYDSEGEFVDIGFAVGVAMPGNSTAYVFAEPFEKEAASARFSSGNRIYDAEFFDSTKNVSVWKLTEPYREDDDGILHMTDNVHLGDEVIVNYYSFKSGDLEAYTETMHLTGCYGDSWLAADYYPQEAEFPAALINENEECVGILEANGIISSVTDPEVFYEYSTDEPAVSGNGSGASEDDTEAWQDATDGYEESRGEAVRPEDAVYGAYLVNKEEDNTDNEKVITMAAVRLDGLTYVITSVDAIQDYDEDTQQIFFIPEDLPEGAGKSVKVTPIPLSDDGDNDFFLEKSSQIAVNISASRLEGVSALPVASEINRSHQLGGIFTYVKKDEESGEFKNQLYNYYIMGYSQAGDNLYFIDEDKIGFEDNWNGGWSGTLVYDMVSGEAVGIGTYVNGNYAFADITSVMRNFAGTNQFGVEYYPVEEWGDFYDEIHSEDD